MDELTLLSEFRSEMSGPTAAETDAARAALIAAMAQVRPGQARTKPSGRRFWLPLAAGTCAAAVGLAAAAASQAAGHGRFFVSESEYIDPSNGRDVPAQRTIWIGNGVTGRLLDRGWGATGSPIPPGLSFGRGVMTWSQLLSLPTAPGPLLAKIAGAS